MDPHRCEPSQSVRRIDVISTTILLDVSVDDSEIYAPMDISYDGNMSCDGETPNLAIQTVRGSFQFSFVNFFTCGCYGCNILFF